MTCRKVNSTEGYKFDGDDQKSITYTAADTTDQFTLKGIVSTEGLSVEGTTVTVNAAALNKETVTLTNADGIETAYKLALGSDVEKSVDTVEPTMITGSSFTIDKDGVY